MSDQTASPPRPRDAEAIAQLPDVVRVYVNDARWWQNASFALRMADRAYVIESGSVVLSGTAQELSDEPRVRHNYLGY
mgnify:CR=1 FL=1